MSLPAPRLPILGGLLALLAVESPVAAQCRGGVTAFPVPGLAGAGYAVQPFTHAGGTELVVGGNFDQVDGLAVSHIARWNGTQWSALGAGLDAAVDSLVVFDDGTGAALYVAYGGWSASTPSRIARWDGAQWSPVPGVAPAPAGEDYGRLYVFDDGTGPALHVLGRFTSIAGVPAVNLARWNGTTWQGFGTGPTDYASVAVLYDDGSGTALHVASWGGTTASTTTLQRWNGASWSVVSTLPNGSLSDLASFDDGTGPALFAAGGFANPITGLTETLLRWAGSSWAPAVAPANTGIRRLAVLDDGTGPRLHAAGVTGTYVNSLRACVDRWDGVAWTRLGGEMPAEQAPEVHALAMADLGAGQELCAVGRFDSAGASGGPGVALLAGGDWTPLGAGRGLSGSIVKAFQVHDDGSGTALFAAGRFTGAGPSAVRNVARWNGTAWSRVGSRILSTVHALASYDDGSGRALYAAHQEDVSRWNGTSWSPLLTGMDWDSVRALAVHDDGTGPRLIAGGEFTTIGGLAAHHVAAWNGTSWSALAGGVNSRVTAFAVHDDGTGPKLHAAGSYTSSSPLHAVARWDGTQWTDIGAPGFRSAYSLVEHDDGSGRALYAGVRRFSAPEIAVARWRNGAWTLLPDGFNSPDPGVRALLSHRVGTARELWAGGAFTQVGSLVVNGLARWNGTAWSAVGAGVGPLPYAESGVAALVEFGSGPSGPLVCVGGAFERAGGLPASRFATFEGCPAGAPTWRSWGSPALVVAGTPFCAGDGSGTPCPCGNSGASGRGCSNSHHAGGAALHALGTPSVAADSIVLVADGTLSGRLLHFLQGSLQENGGLGVARFDGLACLAGTVVRLGTKFSANGGAVLPEAFDAPLSVLGALPAAGGVRHYQAHYRDPAAFFCPPATANWTNGFTLQWVP